MFWWQKKVTNKKNRPASAGSIPLIPQGVGAPPPPGMDPKSGKLMCIKVRMLDDTIGVFHLGHKAFGQSLFDEVCRHLNLLESDYFGLEFHDNDGNHYWLDKDKAILRQVTSSHGNARFYFVVKFYTPNPADLEEEYTRYLFAQQIRRDLAAGDLACHENTAALMASYMVQADCGDFSSDDYPDHSYLVATSFIPNQSSDFQKKVMDNHKKLIGMGPGESDLALLETARRCDFYGIKFHIAKDIEGTPVNLSVTHLGIKVFQQLQCISTFSWAKIRKLSFKRKKLLIKLHPESYQYYKETIEFSFESRNECKNFWKKCVENHAFFRCLDVAPPTKSKEKSLFSRGSSFRYHGRTQKQLIDYVREHRKRREPFTRPLRPALGSETEQRLSRPSHFSTVVRGAPVPMLPMDATARVSNGRMNGGGGHQRASTGTRSSHHRGRPLPPDCDQRMCTSDLESPGLSSSSFSAGPRRAATAVHPILGAARPLGGGVPSSSSAPSGDANMSLSLPNVLDDVQAMCRQECECPPKANSGDNFAGGLDNVSQGSYRLSENESDIMSPSSAVYATTFTTKRIGNVIVKRVVSNTRSTPNTTDDEEEKREKTTKVGNKDKPEQAKISKRPETTSAQCQTSLPMYNAVSSAASASPPKPPPPKPAPPNPAPPNPAPPNPAPPKPAPPMPTPPIYTSSGTILHRPRVIPDIDTYVTANLDENGYSIVKRIDEPAKTTYGAVGPLPGKVITQQDLVVTPEGIREKNKKPKPAVPPKPKNLTAGGAKETRKEHPIVHMVDNEEQPRQEVVAAAATAHQHEAVGGVIEDSHEKPMIRIESEDRPDIQECHLFNDVPYVLTMRTVQTPPACPLSTTGDVQTTSSFFKESDGLRRRRSLDLVPRKSLPGPGEFSSQDHSISPTTPDSGNVLEYLLRRRSASHERSALTKRAKRGEPRRQTQPVRFTLPASSDASEETTSARSDPQLLLDDDNVVVAIDRLREDHLESVDQPMSSCDTLPPPPPPLSIDVLSPPPPSPSYTTSRFLVTPVDLSLAFNNSPPFIDDSSSSASKTPPRRESLNDLEEPSEQATPTEAAPFVQSSRTETGLLWTDF